MRVGCGEGARETEEEGGGCDWVDLYDLRRRVFPIEGCESARTRGILLGYGHLDVGKRHRRWPLYVSSYCPCSERVHEPSRGHVPPLGSLVGFCNAARHLASSMARIVHPWTCDSRRSIRRTYGTILLVMCLYRWNSKPAYTGQTWECASTSLTAVAPRAMDGFATSRRGHGCVVSWLL
jgi:hypothetical protein